MHQPSPAQVDSEILRIHAMKDRALLAALQVPWREVSQDFTVEHGLRLGPKVTLKLFLWHTKSVNA